MPNIKLTSTEKEKVRKLLTDYFSEHHSQTQLNGDTREGETEQELFRNVLLEDGYPDNKDFLKFLHDKIWAIHESLRFGLLDDIIDNNSVSEIREAFRTMLSSISDNASPDEVLAMGRRPYLGVSILSEALCKVYPDQFSIKNKRSEWGLYFIISNVNPNYIENEMSYANFIDICWQVWEFIIAEYEQRGFSYDSSRSLWYVDRFYLWIYERPQTKQIMKSLGYIG